MDHAGATLYAKTQLDVIFKNLSTHLYGNPHSSNPSSKLSSEVVERSRDLILNHFNTDSDSYHVVFTSNCTSALSLLSEIFPWNQSESNLKSNRVTYLAPPEHGSTNTDSVVTQIDTDINLKQEIATTNSDLKHEISTTNTDSTQIHETNPSATDKSSLVSKSRSIFCYLEDNHTSVLGMRETASINNAQLVCITENSITPTTKDHSRSQPLYPPYHLFAYPAQSNFSGIKYPLEWTSGIENGSISITGLTDPGELNGSWLVLLDAASYASTNHLDLSLYPAHFVSLSFYKLFGYPTGLGALLIRSDISHILRGGGERERGYFGGGTVLVSIARERYHISRPLPHERYAIIISSINTVRNR